MDHREVAMGDGPSAPRRARGEATVPSFGTVERGFDPEDAIDAARAFAVREGFGIACETVGDLIRTTTCTLTDSEGRSAVGRGKGLGLQSKASAIFEAFEHHFHAAEDIAGRCCTTTFDTRDLDPALVGGSPDFKLIFRPDVLPLTCLEYRGLADPAARLAFPAVLVQPHFEPPDPAERALVSETRILRYATNSGTASGQTVAQSRLHALMEVIERDAVGMALVATILRPEPLPLRRILRDTLLPPAAALLKAAEAESDGRITLWDVTADIGIPTVLCGLELRKGEDRYRIFGSGASLSRDYALERAMLEAVQGVHVQFGFDYLLQTPMDRDVSQMSLFQRCELDAGYFEVRGGVVDQDAALISDPISTLADRSVAGQLDHAVARLAAHAIESYCREIRIDGIVVSQVVAPRLERIYMLTHGFPVVGGGRARALRSARFAG